MLPIHPCAESTGSSWRSLKMITNACHYYIGVSAVARHDAVPGDPHTPLRKKPVTGRQRDNSGYEIMAISVGLCVMVLQGCVATCTKTKRKTIIEK